MLKHRVSIVEENDFMDMLIWNIQDDFAAMDKPGFYIDFIKGDNKLTVLVYGEKSLVKRVDEFVKHLNDHYIKGLG